MVLPKIYTHSKNYTSGEGSQYCNNDHRHWADLAPGSWSRGERSRKKQRKKNPDWNRPREEDWRRKVDVFNLDSDTESVAQLKTKRTYHEHFGYQGEGPTSTARGPNEFKLTRMTSTPFVSRIQEENPQRSSPHQHHRLISTMGSPTVRVSYWRLYSITRSHGWCCGRQTMHSCARCSHRA